MSASCCGSSRKTAALVVMAAALGVLIPVAVVVGVMTFREPPPAPPQGETVEVVVAATELRYGTVFTHDNVARLTTLKAWPVTALPVGAAIVTSQAELVGKRLERTAHHGEWIFAADIKDKPKVPLLFKPGYDIMSFPLAPGAVRAGAGPGSRIDVVAHYKRGNEQSEFTLLQDMLVLAVDGVATLAPTEPLERYASFQVDQKQAALVTLSSKLDCNFEVVLRRPGDPVPAWDYDATLARLQRLAKEADAPVREVAPFPRAVP